MISSDNELPKLLDTPTKQVKWAKKLVAEHLDSTVTHVDKPPMQGMFSRTFFLALADGREVVLQFRTEPLDLDAFQVARKALGPVVPDARALASGELLREQVWAYSMTRLHGQMWLHGVAGKGAEGRIAINRSLGAAFSRGYLARGSGEAVEGRVRPHLEAILASPLPEILPYRQHVESFLGGNDDDEEKKKNSKLEQLKRLPLWVAHYDLNEVNILIDEDCHVTGLIDWELSSPLPLGVGFGRIHTIAGEFTGGEFWMPDEFEVAERAFWKELFDGMPADVRDMLKSDEMIQLVQDAVILGTLLDGFVFENGKVVFNPVSLKALSKFLTYRIPFVRGENEGPYGET